MTDWPSASQGCKSDSDESAPRGSINANIGRDRPDAALRKQLEEIHHPLCSENVTDERRQEGEDYLVGVEEAQDGHGQLGEEDQRQAEGELKGETDIHRRRSKSDLSFGLKVSRYHLEEADVLSEGSDASAERDEEHDHAHHDEDDGWVDEERVPHCVCQGERREKQPPFTPQPSSPRLLRIVRNHRSEITGVESPERNHRNEPG